ncbi:unnamed protein product [[Candida] boidinii]|nr:unnamed protein product [[Candida] boidinii]
MNPVMLQGSQQQQAPHYFQQQQVPLADPSQFQQIPNHQQNPYSNFSLGSQSANSQNVINPIDPHSRNPSIISNAESNNNNLGYPMNNNLNSSPPKPLN